MGVKEKPVQHKPQIVPQRPEVILKMKFRTKKEQLECVKQICKRDLFTLRQQSSRMLPLLIMERLPPPEDGPGDPRMEEHLRVRC